MTTRYLGFDAAVAYLGITKKALRKRVERRTIPFIRDGRRLRFDTVVLDNYMAERAVALKSDVLAEAEERLSA